MPDGVMMNRFQRPAIVLDDEMDVREIYRSEMDVLEFQFAIFLDLMAQSGMFCASTVRSPVITIQATSRPGQ